MKFILNTAPVPELETACLVVGIFEKTPLQGSAKLIDKASDGALQQLIESGDIDPFWKHTTMLHGLEGVNAKRILVVGCGEPEKFSAVRYDNVCTSAGAFLRDHATTSAHICLHELKAGETDTPMACSSGCRQSGPGQLSLHGHQGAQRR